MSIDWTMAQLRAACSCGSFGFGSSADAAAAGRVSSNPRSRIWLKMEIFQTLLTTTTHKAFRRERIELVARLI